MKKKLKLYLAFFLATIFLMLAGKSFADTISDLQAKIAEREIAIGKLEAEISATQSQIDANQGQQKTLKGVISTFDAELKKVLAQISVTQQKISSKQLEIETLKLGITDKNNSIQKSINGLGEILRATREIESQPMVVALLNSENLSDFWIRFREVETLSKSLNQHIEDLKNLKTDLENNKKKAESARLELISLQKELAGRKKIAESAKAEKQKLLLQTKNQESTYQELLKKQISDKNAFERELLAFESELKFAVDPNSVPSIGSGVLNWPLDVIKITQYFGNTDFASKNPQLYNGMGHNGVDFRASIGTPIKAALSGVIKGTGNTDNACPGASYGKWILIEHENGLSTIYAHLSAISVQAGDKVGTRQIIGWSGNTGYSTGPHLHFGVYATQGVRIMNLKSKVCSGTYTMPVAAFSAYLNPLSYL